MTTITAYEITSHGAHTIPSQAKSADEWTRQAPQGFYTTFRTLASGTKVLGLQAHLDRLYGPAVLKGIQPSVPELELRGVLSGLIRRNAPTESRVRLILSASDSPGAVFALVEPFYPLPDSVYQDGVKVVTAPLERATPRLKSTTFIEKSQSARQLVGGDIFEVLLVQNGRILEGMTSNFFYIKDGLVGTARNHILLGVTRRTVLRVVRGRGLGIQYRPLEREQVPVVSETFITSSSRGIVPVVKIDDWTVGEGEPGPMTKGLMEDYANYVLRNAEPIYLG